MLPDVIIAIQNGQLGGVLTLADGVCALIVTGTAVVDKIAIGEPKVIFSLQDAIDTGIDSVSNDFAYRQIREFYSTAGTGAELYVMLVSDTMTQTSMLDVTNTNGASKLLDFAGGRVRMLFTAFHPDEDYEPTLTSGIDSDVLTAIVKAQQLAEIYAEKQAPIRVFISGRAFTGNAALLPNLRSMSNNRVAVVVGSTGSEGIASVGLFAGRCAAIPVQRKASRVKDRALPIVSAYVGGLSVDTYSGLNLMHDKGFIVLRTFPGVAGYFFSDDPTATSSTDDYAFVARGRVIDKAHIIAYLTFIEELHDEVPIDSSGRLSMGLIKYLETKIENQIGQIMVANGEVSSVNCSIDPNQNILTNNKLIVILRITPVGYNSTIEVQLGFQNPSNS